MQNKHKAGYYSANVDRSAFEYLKNVLKERTEEPQHHIPQSEIIKRINDLDKFDEEPP